MTKMIAAGLILASVLGNSACGIVKVARLAEKEVKPSNDPAVSQPDAAAVNADPRQAVESAYRKLCTTTSFRTRTEMTGPTGNSIVTKAEFVLPDRRRTVQFVGTSAEFETITIGSRTYQKSNGEWSEMSGPLSNAYANPGFECSKASTPQVNVPLPEMKPAGTGDVDGKKVVMFSSTLRAGDTTVTVTTSIGAADGMLYRTESKSAGPDMGDITATTIYSDYNADIRIDAPV